MTITIRDNARQCPDCHGEGFILLEPVNPGGSRVSERCGCQPVPEETDREYWLRLRAEELAFLDAQPVKPFDLVEWRLEAFNREVDTDD